MKKLFIAVALLSLTSAQGAFLELQTADEFKDLIQNSDVPVVVQFSAYWCGPCKSLKALFQKVAPSYSDSQVKLAYVDAYVNSSLQSYLQGGYPTVRTFSKGELTSPAFVGSKSESFLRSFIDKLIKRDEWVADNRIGPSCPAH